MIEKTEIIYLWHKGQNKSSIASSLGMSRNTVRKYIDLAIAAGLSPKKALPSDWEIAKSLNDQQKEQEKKKGSWRKPVQERLVKYDTQLKEWSKDPKISQTQMWRLFKEKYSDEKVGLSTFKAYIRQHYRPSQGKVTVRLVTPAGQAQVDFGYVGKMFDPAKGKERKAWAFVMTLSRSRHRFVRFVFKQDVANWVDCHIRAFEFFGGVPQMIVLDNLKAGVIKPDIYDPTLNRHYQECERHYGFVADPAKVRKPKHKGRVERAIPVVRGHLLAGREFANIDEANERALIWCAQEIGTQVHGTTKQTPIDLFEAEDKGSLLELPLQRFEIAHWQRNTVCHDHHVVFKGAYYSLPTCWIGKEVDIRGSDKLVQIFHQGELIKTHSPVSRGTFQTDPHDYPERQRLYLLETAEVCREKAQTIGEATSAVIEEVLFVKTNTNLRKAHKLLRLANEYGGERFEQVAQQAIDYQTLKVKFFEGALNQPLATQEEPSRPPAPGYLRPSHYFSQEGENLCHIR